MKLAILGGGGFRVPYVYQALLRDPGSPRIEEVWLHDADPRRLEVMEDILGTLAGGDESAPRVFTSTGLDKALEGADFVFAAIRVGGLAGRVCDERVALDLDVLGQETTGPGGIAYGLRTIPVMLDIAHRVRELAPDAYVINFTNPAGMITEAMQGVLGDRVIYQWCPDGLMAAPNVLEFVERRLGVLVSARNWNTVTKLGAMLEEDGS